MQLDPKLIKFLASAPGGIEAFLPKEVKAIWRTPVAELTSESIEPVFELLGLGKLHPELFQSAVALLTDKGIDNAAELVKSDEALRQLVDLATKGPKALPDAAKKYRCTMCDKNVTVLEAHPVHTHLYRCNHCGFLETPNFKES